MAQTPPTKRKRKAPRNERTGRKERVPAQAEERPPWLTPERKAIALVLGVAALLRIFRITADFPVVTDESIYLRWAEIIDNQGGWFVSLLDGKQPFGYWVLALVRFVSDADPLLSARLVSAFAGVAATLVIYTIGRRLANHMAGLIGAGLYAVLPWSMIYDRMAYGEGLVNLFGTLIVWTSLRAFDKESTGWSRAMIAGLALGLGIFTKTTVLLFAFFPVLAGVWLGRRTWARTAATLAVVIAIAAVFPVVSIVAQPEAPTFQTGNIILHQTSFFVSPDKLFDDPLLRVRENAPKLIEYLGPYVTWTTVLASVVSLAYLTWVRSVAGWIIASAALIPLAVQMVILTVLPTRYSYPHIWPLLLVIGLAAAEWWKRAETFEYRRAVLAGLLAIAGLPMLWQTLRIAINPQDHILEADSGMFFGSYPHVGHHIYDAVGQLRTEARTNGPFILLTDAIWGIPADAMFAFLNGKDGIRVHEAWWIKNSPTNPIAPPGRVELIKSHYERVEGGTIDFNRTARVFYVTDSQYVGPEQVRARQPNAQRMWSFPNPEKTGSLDIYLVK